MIMGLLALLAASVGTPPWTAWPSKLPNDLRVPDARETRILGEAICATRQNCKVEDRVPYLGPGPLERPVINRLAAVRVVYGSFTGRNRQEALLTLCFPSSDACDGVSLLRKTGGQWKEISYTKELAPRVPIECLKFTGYDGRDRLTCQDSRMHGLVLYQVTAEPGGLRQKVLFDGTRTGCDTRAVTEYRLWNWRKADVNKDGRPDLVATINRYALGYDEPGCRSAEPKTKDAQQIVRRWSM